LVPTGTTGGPPSGTTGGPSAGPVLAPPQIIKGISDTIGTLLPYLSKADLDTLRLEILTQKSRKKIEANQTTDISKRKLINQVSVLYDKYLSKIKELNTLRTTNPTLVPDLSSPGVFYMLNYVAQNLGAGLDDGTIGQILQTLEQKIKDFGANFFSIYLKNLNSINELIATVEQNPNISVFVKDVYGTGSIPTLNELRKRLINIDISIPDSFNEAINYGKALEKVIKNNAEALAMGKDQNKYATVSAFDSRVKQFVTLLETQKVRREEELAFFSQL